MMCLVLRSAVLDKVLYVLVARESEIRLEGLGTDT
jgi:hypothetical protein